MTVCSLKSEKSNWIDRGDTNKKGRFMKCYRPVVSSSGPNIFILLQIASAVAYDKRSFYNPLIMI
jgi:hypothetical protein